MYLSYTSIAKLSIICFNKAILYFFDLSTDALIYGAGKAKRKNILKVFGLELEQKFLKSIPVAGSRKVVKHNVKSVINFSFLPSL